MPAFANILKLLRGRAWIGLLAQWIAPFFAWGFCEGLIAAGDLSRFWQAAPTDQGFRDFVALMAAFAVFVLVRILWHGPSIVFFIPIVFCGSLLTFCLRAAGIVLHEGFNSAIDLLILATSADVPGVTWILQDTWAFTHGQDLSWWTIVLGIVLLFWVTSLRDVLYLEVSEYLFFNFRSRTPLWILVVGFGIVCAWAELIPFFGGLIKLVPIGAAVYVMLRFPTAIERALVFIRRRVAVPFENARRSKGFGARSETRKSNVEEVPAVAAAAPAAPLPASPVRDAYEPPLPREMSLSDLAQETSAASDAFEDVPEIEMADLPDDPSDEQDPEHEAPGGEEAADDQIESLAGDLEWPAEDEFRAGEAEAVEPAFPDQTVAQEGFWDVVTRGGRGVAGVDLPFDPTDAGRIRTPIAPTLAADFDRTGKISSNTGDGWQPQFGDSQGLDEGDSSVSEAVEQPPNVILGESRRIKMAVYQLEDLSNARLLSGIFTRLRGFIPRDLDRLAETGPEVDLVVRVFRNFGHDQNAAAVAVRRGVQELKERQMSANGSSGDVPPAAPRFGPRPAPVSAPVLNRPGPAAAAAERAGRPIPAAAGVAMEQVINSEAYGDVARSSPPLRADPSPAPQPAPPASGRVFARPAPALSAAQRQSQKLRSSVADQIARVKGTVTDESSRGLPPDALLPRGPDSVDEEFDVGALVGGGLRDITEPGEQHERRSGIVSQQLKTLEQAPPPHIIAPPPGEALISDLEILRDIKAAEPAEVESILQGIRAVVKNSVAGVCRDFAEETLKLGLAPEERETFDQQSNVIWLMGRVADDDWRRKVAILFGVINKSDKAEPDKLLARRKISMIGAETFRKRYDEAVDNVVGLLERDPATSISSQELDRLREYLDRMLEIFPTSAVHHAWRDRFRIGLDRREHALRIDPSRRDEEEEQRAALSAGTSALVSNRMSAETRQILMRFDTLCNFFEKIEVQVAQAAMETGRDRHDDPLVSLQDDFIARGNEALRNLEGRVQKLTEEIGQFLPRDVVGEAMKPVAFLMRLNQRNRSPLYHAIMDARRAKRDIAPTYAKLEQARADLASETAAKDALQKQWADHNRDESDRVWAAASGDVFANLEARILAMRGANVEEADIGKFPPFEIFRYDYSSETLGYFRDDRAGPYRLFGLLSGRPPNQQWTIFFPVYGNGLVWDARKDRSGKLIGTPEIAAGGYSQNTWNLRRLTEDLAPVLKDLPVADVKFLLFGGTVHPEATALLSSALVGMRDSDQKSVTTGIVAVRSDLESDMAGLTKRSGFAPEVEAILAKALSPSVEEPVG